MKKRVLIIAGYYLPAVKGGGPIQSIRNLVDNLSDEFDFYILASDRDLGDDKPFNDIETNNWVNVGKAKVCYINKNCLTWRKTESIINEVRCNILYLNSFFSFKDSIVPNILHKLNRISGIKIILAPRGQFSKGALGLKNWKKKIFVKFALILDLYKGVIWHASTISEREDIERILGKDVEVTIANNLTQNYKNLQYLKNLNKNKGELKLVYIARIHPMKNLLQTLEILKSVKGNVMFNIYGPIEDKAYWDKCKQVINELSHNIIVNYNGQAPNELVNEVYKENHVAILLTLGENFGHSISEALIGGCPVIISDRTPWKNLESYNVGYDIALDNEDKIIEAISRFIEIDNHEYKLVSKCSFEYAKHKSNTNQDIDKYHVLFGI